MADKSEIRINTKIAGGSIFIDGVDVSKYCSSATVHIAMGEPPVFTLYKGSEELERTRLSDEYRVYVNHNTKYCPQCREAMRKDTSSCFTSCPVQYAYVCPACGYREIGL
jgi:hypothetical protein